MPFPKPDPCHGCALDTLGTGFALADGTGSNGVLLVGEALGASEAELSRPFVGKAGHWVAQAFQRRGWRREEFRIANTVCCQPPANFLRGAPYEVGAVTHCAPNLDGVISDMHPRAIVALGEVAMRRVMGLEGITANRGYVEWSPRYGCWTIATFHPSYMMRGLSKLTGVWLYDIERAVDIAQHGFTPFRATYLADPPVGVVDQWAQQVEAAYWASPADVWLAYDIETPYKQVEDEGELDLEAEWFGDRILRIGFAWQGQEALSIPWAPEYFGAIRRLLTLPCVKVLWNASYDNPRIRAQGFAIEGDIWDAMDAWHLLHSDLPRGLSFVTPFAVPNAPRWKHTSRTDPATYNAKDALFTLRIMQWAKPNLEKAHLWDLFQRHCVQLDPILQQMSTAGVLLDDEMRHKVGAELSVELQRLDAAIEVAVPVAARRLHPKDGFKRPPVETAGLVQITRPAEWRECVICGTKNPPAAHTKVFKKKPNGPCAGAEIRAVAGMEERWAHLEPFKASKTQLLTYQQIMGHRPVIDRKRKTETFDDEALAKLTVQYPLDTLYPLIRTQRGISKQRDTYVGTWDEERQRWVGGVPVGPDGRVHTSYRNTPSTWRLSSVNPNLQNWDGRLKGLFIAAPGHVLWEIDFSAIEAVIVGYFANSERYVKAAKLGIHDYVASFMVGQPADLNWDAARLYAYLQDIKRRFKPQREAAKRVVHGGNYGMTPTRQHQLYPEYFPTVKDAGALQQRYKVNIFPEITQWQNDTVAIADKSVILRTPFGYQHAFWKVFEWEKKHGEWESHWGEDAKRALAFKPQNTAAGIIKEAMLRIKAAGYAEFLRLQIHDSLLCEIPTERLDEVAGVITRIMQEPVRCLELPWAPGEYLTIGTESSYGTRWGSLQPWKESTS